MPPGTAAAVEEPGVAAEEPGVPAVAGTVAAGGTVVGGMVTVAAAGVGAGAASASRSVSVVAQPNLTGPDRPMRSPPIHHTRIHIPTATQPTPHTRPTTHNQRGSYFPSAGR